MLKSIVYIVLFWIISTPLLCQKQLVDQLMNNVRIGKVEAINTNSFFLPDNQKKSLESLIPYSKDSLAKVRSKSFGLIASVSTKSSDQSLRKQGIQILLAGCNDKDQAISLYCSHSIQQFKFNDFEEKIKTKISSLLNNNTSTAVELAKLVAFLQMKEQEQVLVSKLTTPRLQPKHKWALELALSRLGNADASAYILSRIKNIPINEDLLYASGSDLVFTRNKEIFSFLFDIINSDEKLCRSANPDSDEMIICGYRVLEYISPAIKDFPVKIDQTGELAGNYEKSLKLAREWWVKNKNSYNLNTEIF